ncbi:MAG: hypothetical protein GY862_12835 [Gammaproteobacteria bacterium]|nr:hypothetical protein [Gammaproteobacteria bacterium]
MSNGGFNFGNVGGNVSVEAGGDVVGGDKTTTTTTTTTITTGFKQDEDKQEFIQKVEDLRKQLRQVKAEIEDAEGIDEDEKDAIVMEVMQQVKALKTAKEEAEQLPAQKEASKEQRNAIEAPLNAVDSIVSKVNKVFKTAVNISEKVKKLAPALLAARHLFGLP